MNNDEDEWDPDYIAPPEPAIPPEPILLIDPKPVKSTKPKMRHDRHGRLMPDNPTVFDEPINRFFKNIDMDNFLLFISENEKYADYALALMDPTLSRHSHAWLMRKFHITLHEFQSIYLDGTRHLALLGMAAGLNTVSQGILQDASPRLENCPRCDGDGIVYFGPQDSRQSKTCPMCKGAKEVRVSGSNHDKDLVLESFGIINQKQGPLVNINQVISGGSGGGLDARLEDMLKVTQTITMGRDDVKTVMEEVE